uniref:Palmitoyltransferase n=1 Tax=Panagrellus redivivus TaxID=6233 RepID=A0A7E4WD74_PANRE
MRFDINSGSRISSAGDAYAETKKVYRKLQPQDFAAIVIVLGVLPVAFLFEITYVFSFFFEFLSDTWFFKVAPLAYCGLNVYLNLYKIVKVGPNGNASDLPSVQKPGYKFCHSCNVNSPPRAHHCPVCETCVMRRDHHCSFGAVCIGHFNQRYFVAAIFNLMVVASIIAWYNFELVLMKIPVRPVDYWFFMFPQVAVAFRFITIYQFSMLMLFASSFAVVLFTAYLISAQVFCIYRGQTRVEYLLGIHAYNLGTMENIKQALGRRWPLIFISPFISSPLESDGITFRTVDTEPQQTKYL